MTDITPRTGAPLLAAAQAQKHVTHNEALYQFDALLCARFLDRDLPAPPASPADGDTYLVKATATGAWVGQDSKIAYWADGAWRFYAPFAGLVAYVADETALVVFNGSAWIDYSSLLSVQNVPLVGVNATADSTNRLSVQSNAVLFSDAPVSGGGTGDMRITLSKQAAANTASLLYQDNFSGCAEMGLAGDDDFHFKVSPDGSAWTEALKLSRGSGLVTLPKGQLKFPAPQNPSSDPNTLDDYAEGTFTPLINGTSVAGAATYTTQVGQYVKIGSLVWIDIELNWTAHTGTGNLIVNGLPFTSALSIGPALSIYAQNIGMTAGNVMTCLLSPGSTQVLLRQTPVGGGGASQVPMDGSGSIIISGFYMAAA
jgi:hypothetical protein